jgi:hypothetical protein
MHDRKCFWCGKALRLYDYKSAKGLFLDKLHDSATIEHLFPKFSALRILNKIPEKAARYVIACRKCNNERSLVDQQKYNSYLKNKPKNPPSFCVL